MSRSDVSRLERGQVATLRVDVVVRIFLALGARLDFLPRWQGGELDRLLNLRHSAMHDSVARQLVALDGWEMAPEVSFSIRGERGVIDILAWHGATRTLLVIELKSEIVDINDLMGSVDRKRRLAPVVARERGWIAERVAMWVIVAEGGTNRRRVAYHRTTLRAAFPDDGRQMVGWLRRPDSGVRCLSFWANDANARAIGGFATVKRVRRSKVRSAAA